VPVEERLRHVIRRNDGPAHDLPADPGEALQAQHDRVRQRLSRRLLAAGLRRGIEGRPVSVDSHTILMYGVYRFAIFNQLQ
jgi:hypothetical protein